MRSRLILAAVVIATIGFVPVAAARERQAPVATGATGTASSPLDRDAALAQVGAALVAFLGLVFLGFQIRSQRSDTRAGWTLSYQAIYNEREFRTIASKCTGFFDAEDAADCVMKIRAIHKASWADDPSLPRTPASSRDARASNNDIRYVLGFFETLGTAYNDRKLARSLIEDDFATPAVYFFVDSWWYICWRRGGKSARMSRLYAEFETFVLSVRTRRSELAHDARPKRHLRLICLPESNASDVEWAAAARLSNALSALAAPDPGVPAALVAAVREQVAAIERARPSTTPMPVGSIKTVLAVPSDIDLVEDVWRHHRVRAKELEAMFTTLSFLELTFVIDQLAAAARSQQSAPRHRPSGLVASG